MSLWEKLVTAGYDVKEARFYLAVLQGGQLTVAEASQRAHVSRSTGYDVAKRLINRGLIQALESPSMEMGPKHTTTLQANNPNSLLAELETHRRHVEELIPELEAIRADIGRPYVRYLEGADGIERALFESLAWCSPIHGILSMKDLETVPGAETMRKYIDGRRENGLWLKVIRSMANEGMLGWPSNTRDLREMRVAPAGHEYPISMLIGDRTVSTLSSGRENFAMIVESSEYAFMQRKLFDVLWDSSNPDHQS